MKIVCFHNPEEENGYLSNWYPSQFIMNNITLHQRKFFIYKSGYRTKRVDG